MRTLTLLLAAATLLGFAPAEVPVRFLFVLSGGRATADRFDHPEGVTVDEANREVYVADAGNDRLLVFGTEGESRAEIRLAVVRRPFSVAVGAGTIYVVGSDSGRVAILDVRGRLRELLDADPRDGKGVNVGKIVLAGERLYAADRANDRLLALDVLARRPLFAFGGHGTEEGHFEALGGLAVGLEENVYAVDMRRAAVSVFDRTGQFLRKFGEAGGSFGQLAMPTDVAVDRTGRVFVIDATRHALMIYDAEGRFLREFGGLGKSLGWFYFPRAVHADASGRVYVVEPFLNRVQVFSTLP